jgi:hypothetical protein
MRTVRSYSWFSAFLLVLKLGVAGAGVKTFRPARKSKLETGTGGVST